ncbi:hypothetical protein [Paenibacillus planticolens]|uniref:Regulator of chromosome condensation (RCC1) repeat-containing protein n=1 Tax=Paenibacillus planticolens TaxID=2654976 RepID=A0ABX1ZFA3_9BACL|nr:hypothetical protein [Paenibacillus planticolens]NOU98770.1 hypothetical protein [Paenibacillus planticolens]
MNGNELEEVSVMSFYRKALHVLIKYKFMVGGLLAVLVLLSTIVYSRTLQNSAGTGGTSVVVAPASSVTPAVPSAEPTPAEPLVSTAPTVRIETQKPTPDPLFSLAACPPDMKWYPATEEASGFTPAEPPSRSPIKGIQQISAGHMFDGAGYGMEFGSSYALAGDGTVYRWGIFGWGEGRRPDAFPKKVEGLPEGDPVIQLEGRFALVDSGGVIDMNAERGPEKIAGLSGVKSIAQADDVSVFTIDSDGVIKLYSMYGQEGKPAVKRVEASFRAVSVTASPYIMLAVDSKGMLWVGQSTLSSVPNADSAPLELPDGGKVARMEATMSYEEAAYILSDKGSWYTMNGSGALKPTVLPQGTTQVAATSRLTAALDKDGYVWVWGKDLGAYDQFGVKPAITETPQRHPALNNVAALTAGSDHLLALTADGRVLTIGSNMYGQLGRQPIFADDLLAIGTWKGVDALFPTYGRAYALKAGDVWTLQDGTVAKPVLLGEKAKKVIMALGHFSVLLEDGRLMVANPDETEPCKLLQTPAPITDVSVALNGVLMALSDGSVFHVEGSISGLGNSVELRFDPKPKGKVIEVSGDPIPFVRTDQGELYFKERTQDGAPLMRLVSFEVPVEMWSPMHYVFFDGIGYIGKALDVNGQVYEVELKLQRDGTNDNETASVQVKKTGRSAIRLTGGVEIGQDGRIRDLNGSFKVEARLPAGVRLRSSASMYHYPIEGRTFFQHLFVAEDDTVYWLGALPYRNSLLTPGEVVLP